MRQITELQITVYSTDGGIDDYTYRDHKKMAAAAQVFMQREDVERVTLSKVLVRPDRIKVRNIAAL